ncbi:Hemin transport system permease protein HmuU [Marinomonas aquimarina]|uniref:Hemin transport system permease protein HmuU n=1 Tax=Marinomonas aquimarina TaxID=295068 RepID=A0A1A8T713_9GAMM|nr:iron ABC transporter permease [Marinomonas aquimarina]SBS27548.1 Hemin transport system permease protein HmuU [Marinomonas aquimarina]
MIAPRYLIWPLLTLTIVSLVCVIAAVTQGSVALSLEQLWQAFQGQGSLLNQTLVWELRVPRVLAAFATGGLLAVAGALMQILLRNPLADPYVLGISGGASVAALLAILAGITGVFLSGAAFIGAVLSTLLVFGLAQGVGRASPMRLLLTGVVIAAGWGACITLMLALAPPQKIPGMLFWLMGDLSYAHTPWLAWLVLVPICFVLMPLGRSLNVLARGPMQAAALGVNVKQLERLVFVIASLLTAVAVTTAGSIGFVGLVVPHMLRLVLGNDQRLILPACALAGGTLVTLADTLARTVIAPEQLPVGVITALLGVPTFLFLLRRGRV